MKTNTRKFFSRAIGFTLTFFWLTVSTPALAVLTSVPLTYQGNPLTSTTVTIVFPDGQTKEEKTDDKGILWFEFPGDGDYKITHNGQVIDTVTIGGGGGLSTTGMVIGGLAVLAGGIAIANDDGSDNDSQPQEPPPPPPPDDDPAELNLPNTQFNLTHTIGESSCPDTVSPPLTIRNTGGSDMSYQVTIQGQLVSIDGPLSGTIAPGASVNLTIRFTCSGYTEGPNSTTVTVEARDVKTNTVVGTTQVNVSVDVTTPQPSVGMLEFSGAVPEMNKTHTIGSSPCPDPFPSFGITNNGGSDLEFMVSGPPWVGGLPSSGVLAPGQVQQMNPVFPCSGFTVGNQTSQVMINATDPETTDELPGLNVNFSLTVQP